MDSTTGLQMAYLKQWAPRSAPAPRPCGSPSSWPGRAGPSGATPASWPDRRPLGPMSTWPISTRPTTSTATTPTTTCGRPWWPGTRPTTTGWPASATTSATRTTAAPSTAAGPCRRPWPRWWPRWPAEVVVLSYNDESWLELRRAPSTCAPARGHVEVLAFDSARYVGARIGIHDPAGRKVGTVSHLRNTEYVLVAGPRARVRPMVGGRGRRRPGRPGGRPGPGRAADPSEGALPV